MNITPQRAASLRSPAAKRSVALGLATALSSCAFFGERPLPSAPGAPAVALTRALPPAAEGAAGRLNPMLSTVAAPSVALALPLSTGSYALALAHVNRGQLPAPATVKVEELLNAVRLDPPPSGSGAALLVGAEAVPPPTASGLTWLIVAVTARGLDARAVTLQLDLNAEVVLRHRLVGYEGRLAASGGPPHVGPAMPSLPAGATAHAVFELELAPAPAPAVRHWGRIRAFAKAADGSTTEAERALEPAIALPAAKDASPSTRLTMALALLGRGLQAAPTADRLEWEALVALLDTLPADLRAHPGVAELIDMVAGARALGVALRSAGESSGSPPPSAP